MICPLIKRGDGLAEVRKYRPRFIEYLKHGEKIELWANGMLDVRTTRNLANNPFLL